MTGSHTWLDQPDGILDDRRLDFDYEHFLDFLERHHGFLLSEHACYAKSSLYEQSVRAPLLVSAPGVTKAGSSTKRLVEVVDIYPTLADLCGLTLPQDLEGTSFVPLMKQPSQPWKTAVFSVDHHGETMVRTERWKLIMVPKNSSIPSAGLLYDEDADPEENTNLYDSPEHRPVMAELKCKTESGKGE